MFNLIFLFLPSSHGEIKKQDLFPNISRSYWIQSLSAEVSSLMPGIAKTYTEVVDLKYRQGIERIEASHQVYSDRISVDLEDWVSKFDRLELEMEAEFRLYTNSERVR